MEHSQYLGPTDARLSGPVCSKSDLQPMIVNGNRIANEIDQKLRSYNIHQLRTLAKHKSISTSINKDPMIEKIKSIFKFKDAHEVVETLRRIENANQRMHPYAMLDPESNPLIIEIRKINHKVETIVERIDAIEHTQRDIREALMRLTQTLTS